MQFDIQARFPDPKFSGIVAIDWEVWNPWLDPRDTSVYAELSFAHAHGDKAAAVAAWNASALQFMVQTLVTARTLRPRAWWAYYGMIGCAAKWNVSAGCVPVH